MIPIFNCTDDLSRIFNRSQLDNEDINKSVKQIIADVKMRGDSAIFEYTKKFDNYELTQDNILLTRAEIDEAIKKVPKDTMTALLNAKENIINYHKRQLRKNDFTPTDGANTGFIYRPVTRAGIYVPGGKASYPSSVLMCALPAVVAGVKDIVMVTPPGEYLNPLTIAAADICGVSKIFRCGGAQAIAGLGYGTDSIPRADVITGPGNIFVAVAKREIFGVSGIDMLAGPSEILIIADKTARAEFVASDMLSQAEHDEMAMSVLLTTDKALAENVKKELDIQLKKLPKKEIAKNSLESFGAIVVCKDIDKAVQISNQLAPEHLELCAERPLKVLESIENAGSVFVGNYSPEPLGDYYAGTNHVLPTSSTARFSSALSVDTYTKRISIINYSKEALLKVADEIILLAETEKLSAHAESIRVRKK